MAEIAKQARRRGKAASGEASSKANGASAQAEEQARDLTDEDDSNGSSSGGGRTITSELKDTFREAAIEVLKPVMRKATTSAAGWSCALVKFCPSAGDTPSAGSTPQVITPAGNRSGRCDGRRTSESRAARRAGLRPAR